MSVCEEDANLSMHSRRPWVGISSQRERERREKGDLAFVYERTFFSYTINHPV